MSRAFSTSSRIAKSLKWRINTTKPVEWAVDALETAMDLVPQLAEKADSAIISGDPHATGNDPWHVTVIVGRKNIKGKDRLTSAHVYPDGTVRFSDKQFGEVKVSAREAATGEQGSAGPAESAEPAGPKWIWDEAENRYRYWNGAEWIWQ